MALIQRSISPDAGFLAAAAQSISEFARENELTPADLSSLQVILPNLKLANDLAQTLRATVDGPILLPHMATLSGMVEAWLPRFNPVSDARRQLILHSQLRGRNWFDESLLWDVVAELTGLFDALTEHAVKLPADEAALLRQLEQAFELNDSAALAFEARLVNTLWLAEAQGQPSHVAACLLACRMWMEALRQPLVVVAEERDAGLLQGQLEDLAQRLPVLLLCPDRGLSQGGLAGILNAAWPLAGSPEETQALHERAQALAPEAMTEASESLGLVSADSLEGLAQAVADQVLEWAHAGREKIALIALDRLAARRARALLERDGVLVQDETGWKMSTTRAAAVVDAWLEVLASDAYHRSLVDLLRAPMLFADMADEQRAAAGLAVEELITETGVASGLERLLREAAGQPLAASVLTRLGDARALMQTNRPASISEWLQRLRSSLDALGALPCFARDNAGRAWLEWHEMRLGELTGETAVFSFTSWRHWFNRQMDSSLYRDESIDSPVIMTHLAATRLRCFDGVILVGADAEHMVPGAQPVWLTHSALRRSLGLPPLEAALAQQREDIAGLMLGSGQTLIAWQSRNRGEELMPAPEISMLISTLSAGGKDAVVRRHGAWNVPPSDIVFDRHLPSPQVPRQRIPDQLSASAMHNLLTCPYRYFARYILRLDEQDVLSEAMEKSDFGNQLHDMLNKFHQKYPHLIDQESTVLLQTLETMTEEAFAAVVERNFQDHAWRLRWRSRLSAYIAWQCEREREGWIWAGGEIERRRDMVLGNGEMLRLKGRIDRMDTASHEGQKQVALLDYKTRGMASLRNQAQDPDDVQLAFYALLNDMDVAEAGYVALDDQSVGMARIAEPQARAASLEACIRACFEGMHAGQGMTAQGTPGNCAYCEMRGVCRKEWLA